MTWLGWMIAVVLLWLPAAATPHTRSQTVRTDCIGVAAPNSVIRFRCAVTLPARVRLTGDSLIYVELKPR